jgi:transposase
MEGMEKAQIEAMLSEGLSLAAIGQRVGCREWVVANWVEKYGLQANGRERHAAKGALDREETERLVAQGMTIAEIALELDRSKTTVRHWLSQYGLRTQNTRGRRRSPDAVAALEKGLTETVLSCPRHGEVSFVLDGRGYYRCRRCRAESVTRRRRKMKATLVQEAGGSCRLCGYAKSMAGLQFHHLDPAEKRFDLNAGGAALALDTLRAEARKCVLLCSNCHAEVEDSIRREPGWRLNPWET